jgi:hypothetical protein
VFTLARASGAEIVNVSRNNATVDADPDARRDMPGMDLPGHPHLSRVPQPGQPFDRLRQRQQI